MPRKDLTSGVAVARVSRRRKRKRGRRRVKSREDGTQYVREKEGTLKRRGERGVREKGEGREREKEKDRKKGMSFSSKEKPP